MVALAQELIDAIIDQVGARNWDGPMDYATLAACSLAAHAFRATSQRYLFHSVTVKDDRAAGLLQLFTGSPHLALHVRDIHLNIKTGLDSQTCPELATLLRLFREVQRLTFDPSPRPWRWNRYTVDLRDALLSLFSQPTLRSAAVLNCYNVPSSIVRRLLMSLAEVALHEVYTISSAPDQLCQELDGLAPVILDHLYVGYEKLREVSVALPLICSAEIEQRLEPLRCLSLFSTSALGPISGKATHPLEHLSITFDFTEIPITLPDLPRLRTLTLRSYSYRADMSISALAVLRSLPNCAPRLERMNYIIMEPVFDFADHELDLPGVDAALRLLPRLARLHFSADTAFNLESCMRRTFPRASDAGVLTFSTRERSDILEDHPMRFFIN
ncbi:hypothetical protein B0H15DRAFT_933870 [Mycena belliarum]|uniref:Uncharacterized protein n=1 Tax=Mycena belliarum TaxID=1033014 RepID=A0AAD6TTV4_9AGAR|nr:hypothetical protein B0H15DRAFT_933870 [Mycena belliae]